MSNLQIVEAPSRLEAEPYLPASKSLSNRALIIRAIAGSQAPITNLSEADDTLILQQMLRSRDSDYYAGDAGTVMRFMTAYLASRPGSYSLYGSERMHQRPIYPLVDALRSLGADIDYLEHEGYPPLIIEGRPLKGGSVEVDAGLSSQFISALMMIGPSMEQGLELKMRTLPVSWPYVRMTRDLMHYFGVEVQMNDGQSIRVAPSHYLHKAYTVEPDWSSVIFWLGILSTIKSGYVMLRNFPAYSMQGDSNTLQLMRDFGIVHENRNGDLLCYPTRNRKWQIQQNLVNNPDLIPAYVTTCLFHQVHFRVEGIQTLRHKESDRVKALMEMAQLMGISLEADETALWSQHLGNAFEVPEGVIPTYGDHRLAMSAMILAARYHQLFIEHPQSVRKSYPQFWQEIERAGFSFEVR